MRKEDGVFMGVFAIGDTIKSVDEYGNYRGTHLYFHGSLIGKSITDNWQFRLISNGIKDGFFNRAKAAEGCYIYKVILLLFDTAIYNSKPIKFTHVVADRSPEKAIQGCIKMHDIKYKNTFVQGEYISDDESMIIKAEVYRQGEQI